MFTIELHPEQVIPLLFRFHGTTADESRKIIFPIIPVDHLSPIISNGVVSFVVDVIRKCSLMSLVFKATQWFKWYITVDRILTEIGHCKFQRKNSQLRFLIYLLSAQFLSINTQKVSYTRYRNHVMKEIESWHNATIFSLLVRALEKKVNLCIPYNI